MAGRPAKGFDAETRHEVINHPQKFVRYKDGHKIYGICQSTFEKLAWDANAVYKINKVCLVNLEILENYLETFRIVERR